MKYKAIIAALLVIASPVAAQNVLDSSNVSGSNSAANSGSQSASQSNPTVTTNNDASNVNAQGNISTNSASNSNAISGSSSNSGSVSDQSQGQTQGQTSNQTNMQGQQATNQQGVNISTTYNTQQLRRTYVGTNAAVPLAASSSFSSDYCGGTVSGGASVAPIGVSIGGAKPTFDKSCQSLRRAEKFGMAAANAMNMQQPELAGKLMSMMIWSICTSDSSGTDATAPTAQACEKMALMGSQASAMAPEPALAPDPAITGDTGHPTPEAVTRAGERGAVLDRMAVTLPVVRTDLAASMVAPR